MFDINGSEFLVIAVIAVILVGPERLPEYVRGLRSFAKRARGALREGQAALTSEFGEDVDWKQFDPRQYDPRKIVREALFDDDDATPAAGPAPVAAATGTVGTAGTAAVGSRRKRRSAASDPAVVEAVAGAPFDDEAT
ncbi:MAG: twin-arginine translocase TatA/TatE family subunit [Demequina sp.]|uniref:twin-arginine translocase TatA/TatE family subunit n=1 Tax=Demequina sp. TaxID=2050685 RepID=UPI0019AA0E31|nr:twin-arginine translocase TatA/TatE family subunit [Demequina sp.]MBC7298218.1 twin-arginine translocase TatA/TatE family subunit [Demequina sp.]